MTPEPTNPLARFGAQLGVQRPSDQDLTPEQLRAVLTQLGRSDAERAHGLEDDLAHAALAAIRDGRHPDPAGLARDVLVVLDADYQRWFA